MTRNKAYAVVIGAGIMLFAIHNPYQPFIEYSFLPQVGLMMTAIGVALYVVDNWGAISLGDKRIWIPLLVIAVSIGASGIVQMVNGEVGIYKGFGPLMMGALLFLLYLTARSVGSDIFSPFLYAVVFGFVGCVLCGLVFPGRLTGGVISPTNYDIAAGLLVFGTVVSAVRKQWWLSTIALVGLFFCGAPEGIVAIAGLGLLVLIRRDWSRKLILPVASLILVAGIWCGVGAGIKLYSYTFWMGQTVWASVQGEDYYNLNPDRPDDPGNFTGRIVFTRGSLIEQYGSPNEDMGDKAGGEADMPVVSKNTADKVGEKSSPDRAGILRMIFGTGYNLTDFSVDTIHNVPLVIVQQVGPVAAVAWLWVTVFCLVKTKWKYAFSAVLILGVFDHYLWTQVAPWWWALVGVASVSSIKSDLIFRRDDETLALSDAQSKTYEPPA